MSAPASNATTSAELASEASSSSERPRTSSPPRRSSIARKHSGEPFTDSSTSVSATLSKPSPPLEPHRSEARRASELHSETELELVQGVKRDGRAGREVVVDVVRAEAEVPRRPEVRAERERRDADVAVGRARVGDA